MKTSLEWLREYAHLDAPVDELVKALVDTGTEVETVEHAAEGAMVARVVALTDIPESTRGVRLAEIDTGSGEHVQVVTGAPNVKVGDLVAYGPPGTSCPVGLTPSRSRRCSAAATRRPGCCCPPPSWGSATMPAAC